MSRDAEDERMGGALTQKNGRPNTFSVSAMPATRPV